MTAIPEPLSLTVGRIYAAYEAARGDDDERDYLGMSTFGDECDRSLWYGFRWVSPPQKFDGRMLRLFQTGHREEARMIEDLRMAGITILDRDPSTDQQWELIGVMGHLKGHMDGDGIGFPEAPKTWHVCEFKTHNDDGFVELKKKKVEKAKPGHYFQMQFYMHYRSRERAFYLAHNKDNDDLHPERVSYDPVVAARLNARAARIIQSERPPAKLHEDASKPSAFHCLFCNHRNVCHEKQWPRFNCRTCLYATPVEGGQWHCSRFKKLITIEEQKTGCPAHLFIPELVPGEQRDVDTKAHTVTYKLHDGRWWVDGAGDRAP